MKLTKLDEPMQDLLGNEMLFGDKPLTLRSAIITIISKGFAQDPVAAMEIPHKLMHAAEVKGYDGSCTLTNAEGELLKDAALADRNFPNLVKAQVIKAVKEK